MTKPTKPAPLWFERQGALDAVRVGTLGMLGFAASIIVVVDYRDFLWQINWALVVLVFGIGSVGFALYWFNLHKGPYDVRDLVMTNGVADLGKHMILFFAFLSAWVIIQKVLLDPKGDITGLITIVLGTFVGEKVLNRFADAMRDRPAAFSRSQDVNILQGAKVAPTVDAPAES